jgi:SAM-dependent methyltransferase
LSVAYDGGRHTKHRHTRYHDFFVNRVSPGERVLDVGCGQGFVAWDLALRSSAVVTGIDISRDNIAAARAAHVHPHLSFVHGDATVGVPGGPWDVIVLSNVLEHIEHRELFLAALARESPRGRYLVRVPLFERDWRVPLKRELGVEWRLDDTHFTEYTAESFAEEVRAAGFSPVHVEYRWSEIWAEIRWVEAVTPIEGRPRLQAAGPRT